MSLDPEFVRAILGGEEDDSFEYTEDFRDRLSQAPLFDRARELQVELLDAPIHEDDLVTAWHDSQELLQSLDVEAAQAGLLRRVVILRGKGVEIPKFDINLVTGSTTIGVADNAHIDKQSIEKYYATDEMKGLFAGFTLRYVRVENDTYIARLAYQVLINGANIPLARMTLCATGFVGVSQLSFEEDEKLDAVHPLLERLFLLCPDDIDELNRLNVALAIPEAHNGLSIRRVSRLAEKIVNNNEGEKAQLIEDGIIELVSHYVEIGNQYEIVTPNFSLSAENPLEETEYFEKKDFFAITGPSTGIIFMLKTLLKDGKPVFQDKKVLNIVLAHNGHNLYIPLAKAQEFREQ